MSFLTLTYVLYLAVTVYITVVVGWKLHHHGRPFLIECFTGRTALADAVNHLLLIGYYLTNFALAAFLLRTGLRPTSYFEMGELLSSKLGTVLLILGAMHFVNVLTALAIRQRRLSQA